MRTLLTLLWGVTCGSYVAALKYAKDREQFKRPIAKFQIVQEKLARMQANAVAVIAYSTRIAEMQEKGNELMLNSALAKMHNSLVMRETVALARETCGGNGITLETDVARFFADAESIYTYEGSHEVNALIVGRDYWTRCLCLMSEGRLKDFCSIVLASCTGFCKIRRRK